jgi:periplasmic mercuric ion binding protein
MKKILLFVLAFIGMQIYYSCTSQTGDGKSNLVSNSEMTVTVDGMTCESGCAKHIEKTVAELSGVTFSKVNFEEKTATFKFDDTKTTEKDILAAIASLNEGQYKVTNVEVKVEKTINEGEEEKEVDAIEEELMNDTAV